MISLLVLIELYHRINDFLGTPAGSLVTITFQLIVFTIISYMLFSEFLKTRRSDLKYLGVGFSLLLVSKSLVVCSLLFQVFIKNRGIIINGFFPALSHFLEVFGWLIISFGFIHPVYKQHFRKYYTLLQLQGLCLLILGMIFLFHWTPIAAKNIGLSYQYNYIGYSIIESIKIIILLITIYLVLRRQEFIGRYSFQLAFVISLFIIPSILTLSDILFFDGGNKFLKALSHPFPFLAGMLLIRVIFLKVVDKAILQQKLSQAEEKSRIAERLASMKEDFVSMVSHELRTPLTSMKLYISLLLNGQFGEVSKEQKKTITLLKEETDRLSNLIEDILSLSKIEHDKQTMQKEDVNLHDLVDETLYCHLAKKKKIIIDNKIPNDMNVTLDVEKFKQVIINLFSNAIKFTPPKGTIAISAKMHNKTWDFIFSDTGKGIQQEHIPKLFDKFYQVEHHMTREQGGTGLGLTIVKKIVELHHGTIKVESEVGKGTMFLITFPREVKDGKEGIKNE